MTKLFGAIRKLLWRDEGASVAEYAVLLLLIAAAALAGMTLLGTAISNFFVSAAGSI